MKAPYLVQRAAICNPLAPTTTRLGEAVNLDYMGAAEYEFGAMPSSLRAFRNGTRVLRSVDNIRDNKRPLYVLSCFTDDEFPEYVKYLMRLRGNDIRCKVSPRFSADFVASGTDFWWDIQNQAIWSFRKDFMDNCEAYLQSSFAYMDAIAK